MQVGRRETTDHMCRKKMFLQTTTDNNILDLEMLTLHNLQA